MVPPPVFNSGRNRTVNPPHSDHGPVTWGLIGKVTLGAIISWAAWEFRGMRDAVYHGQERIGVIEAKVENHEKAIDEVKSQVKRLEAHVYEGP